jgi:N-acetylneuraminic acid mutarotase
VRRSLAALLVAAASVAGCSAASTQSAPSKAGSKQALTTSSDAPRAARKVHVVAATYLHLPVGVSRTVVVPQGSSSLLVLGGLAAGDSTTARAWRIDVGRAAAAAARPLAMAVHDASGATVPGGALVFGGGAATTVAKVQQWTTAGARVVGSLPQPRSDSTAAVIGGTAYVVGGFTGSSMARDVLATTNGRSFRRVARLRIGVRYPALAAVGGQLYVVGGALATTEGTANGAQTDAVQRVDPASGQTTVIGHLPAPLAHAMAFSLGGFLFVAGGRHGAVATSAIERIDVRTGRATRVGSLPLAESDAGVAVVSGAAWLVGGETSGPGAPVSTVLRLRLQS